MATRPLLCTQCATQVVIFEEAITSLDFGPAVVDADGVVHAPHADDLGSVSDPIPHRTYAVCPSKDCGHRWRLRRRFEGAW